MKTLAKIIIILAVFALVTGFMVTAVNASGTISNDRSQFDQPNGSGFRPEGIRLEGDRSEGGEREGGLGWIFGALKNVAVIAGITTMIVWPKSIKKAKRKATGVQASDISQ